MPLYPSFAYVTKANQLVGSAVEPANTLIACDATLRNQYVAAGQGIGLDYYAGFDLSALGFAKVGRRRT